MKEVYLNELSEEMVFIIEKVGMNNFMELCNYFQGESIYFPKMKSHELHERNNNIIKEYNGRNTKELANKYCISDRQIKRIIRNKS
ncbi:MAG: Mor transcription activator family protein [Sarcina sp.]